MSKQVMRDLGSIGGDFPNVQAASSVSSTTQP